MKLPRHAKRLSRCFSALIAIFLWASISFAGDLEQRLGKAAKEGNEAEIVNLLAQGADVNAWDEDGATALFYASLNGSSSVIKALRSSGADRYVKGFEGPRNSDPAADILRCQEESKYILESLVRALFFTMSAAVDTYRTEHSRYPLDGAFLTPPYIGKNYCGTEYYGHIIKCSFDENGYIFQAIPADGLGNRILSLSTGGITNF